MMPVTTDACIFGTYIEIENSGNVLDIGSGTGLLSLMMAQRYPEVHISAIDIDPDSIAISAGNFLNSLWSKRIHAIQGDINTFVFERSFNTIVCNPPFFEKQLRSPHDEHNRSRHDRNFGYKGLGQAVARILDPNGKCFLLVPTIHEKLIAEIFNALEFYLNKKTSICSFENSPAHVLILEFSRQPSEKPSETITTYTSPNIYSEKIKSLLRDFYLNF